jgi:hypothetical protein
MIGRNAGNGFDTFTVNARLSRMFSIGERVKLEGIVDAFNALNHRNNLIPNGTWGAGTYPATPSSSFGQATAVGEPRGIEIAAKLSF